MEKIDSTSGHLHVTTVASNFCEHYGVRILADQLLEFTVNHWKVSITILVGIGILNGSTLYYKSTGYTCILKFVKSVNQHGDFTEGLYVEKWDKNRSVNTLFEKCYMIIFSRWFDLIWE